MGEIMSALQSTAIFRLKKHWASLDRRTRDMFQDLNGLISRDAAYKRMRAHLRAVNPPCIPYLGLYLTDLTFVEEGNDDHIEFKGRKLINFAKCWLVAGIIQKVRQYQQTKYKPEGDEAVEGFQVLRTLLASGAHVFDDEGEAYARSLVI